MKAVVLAGGDLLPSPRLVRLLAGNSLVVAADSGLRHARTLGLEPLAVVGDFDSVAEADLAWFPELPRLRHPVHKDQLDLELAIELAVEAGAEELVVLGAFGSRFDQSLAALLIGTRLRRQGVAISLHDGLRDAYPLTAGDELTLDLPAGKSFSLLALEDARCTVGGAEYPLTDAPLAVGVGLGLANRSLGTPTIVVHGGTVAVVVEWLLDEPSPGLSG